MFAHPSGLLVAFFSILAFHGSVYLLVALIAGWRFGYWITAASTSALFFIMTTFWVITALGPRGIEPHWVPVGAAQDTVAQVTVNDQTLTSPSNYPGGTWSAVTNDSGALDQSQPHASEADPLKSALGNCVDTAPDHLEENLVDVCTEVQSLLPATDTLPRADGLPVTVLKSIQNIRFNEEDGVLLGTAVVQPITKDPRVTDDVENGRPLGDPFVVTAYRDPGSLRLPAIKYFIFSILMLAFHLWGLNRAEKRGTSFVAETVDA